MLDWLRRFAIALGSRPDLVVVALVVTTILMMILPLPTVLVDILIGINLSGSVLLLMMALTLRNPLELSTLPSVILILTVFRLALSITTTRLILLQADAGDIVATFGSFVIAGELIVGLVIFLIITVVQFVVITKGAERVAEVSARFTLDALPGKQMSIDSDLRNGDIDAKEARARRKALEKENQFFGAMDGAMKFVKGDAIAGLVIIAINLIGGISIGVFQKSMSANEAMEVYSLLTIGDGLVAQLPALFVSLAAGSVITRVATDDSQNMGSDISRQIFGSTTAVRMAAVIMAGLALVPGLPPLIFLGISALFFTLSYLPEIKRAIWGEEVEEGPTPAEQAAAAAKARSEESSCAVRLGAEVLPAQEDRDRLAARLAAAADAATLRTGVEISPPRLIDADPERDGPGVIQDPLRVLVTLDDVPLASIDAPQGDVATDAADEQLELLSLSGRSAEAPPPGFERLIYLPESASGPLEEAGLNVFDSVDVIAGAVDALLQQRASSFIGLQETRAIVTRMQVQAPDLAAEVRENLSLNKLTEVLKRLVEEGVPIGNARRLFEALAEWGPKESDPIVLTEYVRTSLARQICHGVAGASRVMPVYLLSPQIEEMVGSAVRRTTVGEYMTLDEETSARIVTRVQEAVRKPLEGGAKPCVVASLDTRRFLRSLLASNGLNDLPVLSHHELSADFDIVPVATIQL